MAACSIHARTRKPPCRHGRGRERRSPGAVAIDTWRHGVANPVGAWALTRLARSFMRTPERGAATIVYAATSPDLQDKTGLYLVSDQPQQPAPLGRDDALTERLWTESARLTQPAVE